MDAKFDVPPEIAQAVPGTIGSIVALRWIIGTPVQRLLSFIGGASTAYWGTNPILHYLDPKVNGLFGFAAFLLGLFGMAVAAKLYDGIAAFNIGARLDMILRRWGL